MVDECRDCGLPEAAHPIQECAYFDAVLEGEGSVELKAVHVRRIECDSCGNGAWFRNTFLLHNARSNRNSSGYGKDDISRCSDAEQFKCKKCQPVDDRGFSLRTPTHGDSEYRWGSTFDAARMPYMFLERVEAEVRVSDIEAWLAQKNKAGVA